jgi:predicted nucleotidyltransferase
MPKSVKVYSSGVELPRSVWKVIDRGVAAAKPHRVLLFGSRARGAGRPTSDFDLAFEGVEDPKAWQEFRLDQIYEPICLFPLDLVRLETAPPELRAEIERDAVEVWRRDP